MTQIGITERGDAALSHDWTDWVSQGKPAILITKDPFAIADTLACLEEPNVIVHCTITGYGRTEIEPEVPHLLNATNGYEDLVSLLGPERVVLRVDPVFPSGRGTKIAQKVLSHHIPNTRIRISFLDAYPHVVKRFKDAGRAVPPYNFNAPLETRKQILSELEKFCGTSIEVCGELGMSCTGCVSVLDLQTFGLEIQDTRIGKQRKSCSCLAQKKELLNIKGRCPHKCLYCYWK